MHETRLVVVSGEKEWGPREVPDGRRMQWGSKNWAASSHVWDSFLWVPETTILNGPFFIMLCLANAPWDLCAVLLSSLKNFFWVLRPSAICVHMHVCVCVYVCIRGGLPTYDTKQFSTSAGRPGTQLNSDTICPWRQHQIPQVKGSIL